MGAWGAPSAGAARGGPQGRLYEDHISSAPQDDLPGDRVVRGRRCQRRLDGPVDIDDDVDVDVDVDDMDEADLLAAGATAEQLYAASLRRAAVIWAANEVVSSCADDLTVLDWDALTGLPDPDSGLDEPFLWTFFPSRFRGAYTRGFQLDVLVTAAKVAYDLARPDAGPPACIAEELVMNAVIHIALAGIEQAGLGRPWLDPSEVLLEDVDFEVLFSPDMDGIEADPATQRDLGMWVPGAADWFTPFNSGRIVHPFCQTEHTGPRAHDLHRLLDEDTDDQPFDPAIVDRPDPIAGLDPLSDTVREARRNQDSSAADTWVPDADHPDDSYAQLLALTGDGAASGWLTWQPDEGADAVRTQPVLWFRRSPPPRRSCSCRWQQWPPSGSIRACVLATTRRRPPCPAQATTRQRLRDTRPLNARATQGPASRIRARVSATSRASGLSGP
jgi:hypothetical protein